MTETADWIAVDWGTTNLRVWVMSAAGAVIARRSSDRGMSTLRPDEFEDALLALVGDSLDAGRVTPVIACGMVGARQGWTEAAYAPVPCPPPGANRAVRAQARDPRLAVHILPGLSQSRPADVMRGEETQIGGFLAANPDFDGTICLPGTHSKWVQISAGEIVSFRTFMTGDLFAAISGHTVLRHSFAAGRDDDAFDAGLAEGLGNPALLTTQLFALRAEGLLHGLAPIAATERLSGLLIGQELAGAKHYWLGARVALVGGAALCARYARALAAQGVAAETFEGDEVVLSGLRAARAALGRNGAAS